MSQSDVLRARISALASVAFEAVPAVWPIGGFIATNPLGGYEGLPFADAVAAVSGRTGARGFLSEADYRTQYSGGVISPAALDRALERLMESLQNEMHVFFGRSIFTRDILRLSFVSDLTARPSPHAIDAAVASRLRAWGGSASASAATLGTHARSEDSTFAAFVDQRCGTEIEAHIDERTIAWCAAFVDEGEAAWPMPYREFGLYAAWRRLAPHDTSRTAAEIPGYRHLIKQTFVRPEDTIAASLSLLGIERRDWESYLARHALRLPGWAGFARWRAANPLDPGQRAAPLDPVQYLAVRLWYESALVNALAQRHGIAPNREAFADRFGDPIYERPMLALNAIVANIAAALELGEAEVLALEDEDISWLVNAATALSPERRGMVWLQAHELQLRDELLAAMQERPRSTDAAATADVVFCIDVRSEGYRRHLEAAGPYRTRGFAGFYGLPISFRSLASEWSQQACPVLLSPKNQIVEHSHDAPAVTDRHRRGRSLLFDLGRILDEVKGSAASPFVLFESIGALFAIALAGRTFLPRAFARMRRRLILSLAPPIATTFSLEKAAHYDAAVGFTRAERLFFAESALALMGMRSEFSELVLLVGHGSTTENNPFEASLDCGACAGYRGGPNARILAAMLNRDDVRADLAQRGIHIPASTVFVGAEHDTAIDRVTILDAFLVPASHTAELATLQSHLDVAGARLAAERGSALGVHTRRPLTHVAGRSSDWAQVRPEWGLARNAAFVIAPRSLSAGADLKTRTFMHEYDVDGDEDGALLEIIMTAPLVVAQWINNHYYFATVDNERYGRGSTVIPHVVARVGVMSGNRSDLRAGLPLQSLADRNGWYHDPVRLLAVVMAPRDRIDAVVGRNAILRRLFHNEWIAMVALDPQTRSFWEYTAGGSWRPHAALDEPSMSTPFPVTSAA